MTAVMVTCPCCCGAGVVELTGVFADTLAFVRGLARETTGAELGRLLGIERTAANNRLAALEKKGLLASRRHGRRRLYRVAKEAS